MGKPWVLQGKGYLLEQQMERLRDLRDEIADLHGVSRTPVHDLMALEGSSSGVGES
jgi:hypothetical protein